MWCSMGPSKVYGTPDVAGWRWNCRGFTAGTCQQWNWIAPNIGGRSCTPGGKPEPQEAQEVTTSSPECPETPKSEEPQSGLMLQVQLPLHPKHQPPIVTSPRTQAEPIAGRKELLSWWQELRSLHHKGTRPLSDSQVQELARKQAVAFRLPAGQEKSHQWNTPPSLVGLRHGDFLPPSPPRSHVPRDIWVMGCNETGVLAWALKQCAILLGTPWGILCSTV